MPIPLTGGLLSGQVCDVEGRPLAGAVISVFDRSTRRVAHVDSDAYGLFAAAVAPGEHRIRAEAGGFQAVDNVVEVQWGRHAEVGRLTLRPDITAAPPAAGIYDIDPDHTSIRFVARHIAMSRVFGRFNRFRGQIQIAEPFEDSHVDVVIDAASVDTQIAQRDAHLRSADFLDVERFPWLRFSSTRFSGRGGNKWLIDGELTLHGLTSDVQLNTTFLGMQEWNGTRAGAIARTELHREHFTLNWTQALAHGLPVIGSTIEITLDVQAIVKT
ncbi:hypothetical protein HF526_09230 [Pseudonocardia sp. K10HN5]|uniref:Lipid/polyisoprenoid-binding YceI-like domain-containing protein n=1 Tax=Pseudonocardia acidicola TaxID=2724939 RepID=A0ABX1S9K0_9PSEU|nr:hypothetical protein [Pseudonocardia acidicola]